MFGIGLPAMILVFYWATAGTTDPDIIVLRKLALLLIICGFLFLGLMAAVAITHPHPNTWR